MSASRPVVPTASPVPGRPARRGLRRPRHPVARRLTDQVAGVPPRASRAAGPDPFRVGSVTTAVTLPTQNWHVPTDACAARARPSIGRALAQALRVAAPPLGVEAPLRRAAGRLRRAARRGRGDRRGDDVAQRSIAASRLRSCERRSDAVTVSVPSTSAAPSRRRASDRCCSVSAAERSRSHVSSTRESVVLTCWPPAPDEREKRHVSSAAGIMTVGPTRTSSMHASHQAGTKCRSNSSRPWSCVEMPGRVGLRDAVVGEHDVGAADDLDRVAGLPGLDVERDRLRGRRAA